MAHSYPCIIVDDDEIDRLTVLSFVKKYSCFDITGIYSSAEEALESLTEEMPLVAFFDVDMPGISGLELRQQLNNIPACVFISSYPNYAIEGFELAALDFISKPVKAERFEKTVKRITNFFELQQKAALLDETLGGNTVFIKEGTEQIKIPLQDILYLEAMGDFTNIITDIRKYCVSFSLGNLLKEKNFAGFIRIHKSYAVQKNFVGRVKANEVFIKNVSLPVGRNFKHSLDVLKQ